MSPISNHGGSTTRHFMISEFPKAIASLPHPSTRADAQAALDKVGPQHGAVAERLFAYENTAPGSTPSLDAIVVEDAMVRAARSGAPEATQLVWCALLLAESRYATATEQFLTTPDGQLDHSRFDTDALESYLIAQGVGSARKTATNLLRYFETAQVVVPLRVAGSISGIERELPTASAVPGLVELVRERLALQGVVPPPSVDPADLALAVGANHWLNLTPAEFRRAAMGLGAPHAAIQRGPIPSELSELVVEASRKRQVVLQGPPGTGKTFLARKYIDWFTASHAAECRLGTILESLPEHEATPERVANLVAAAGWPGIWDIVQFHPSMAYDDFVRSLSAKPVPGGVTFVAVNRTFAFMCEVASELQAVGSTADALLVIDEINRADLSKVLGELIYGLEYRDEPISTPYSVEGSSTLRVPANLYVLGTMNTADRSIALIDYALRRRFVYLDVLPSREALSAASFDDEKTRTAALRVFDAVAQLFEGSAELRSIQVGHSYFMPNATGLSHAELMARRLVYEVLPLLLEYEAEGRFEDGSVSRLLETLNLKTPVNEGHVDQSALLAELSAAIAVGFPPSTAFSQNPASSPIDETQGAQGASPPPGP
jgi:5-methylcytosine-specific restriction protein B